ncbi:MAG TPA: glycosyltransferase family A protein [Candidatus Acidoferrum sp.]|nr:glycosyltransferase family A protein [Candidatus Acidoferrum sp.]
MPTVSVIVPNYNHANFLRERLDTILAQTFQDFELILLDDASTDESGEILRDYARRAEAGAPIDCAQGKPAPRDLRLELNETNSGSTFKQWNKGVRMARGKYVWIAESDDYSDPRFLERMVALLEADERVVIAYCRSHRVIMLGAGTILGGTEQIRKASEARAEGRDCIVDGYGDPLIRGPQVKRWRTGFVADGVEECGRYFPLANLVRNASSAVFRKDAYEAAGGADENMRFCGDWKLWAGLALRGKMAYTSEPLNYYRLHPGSVWGDRSGAPEIQELLHVVRWVMEHATPTDAAREAASKRLSFAWVMVLMSLRVPLTQKRAMWNDIRAIDPHPLRRVVRPALKTISMKIRRHWRQLRLIKIARIAS